MSLYESVRRQIVPIHPEGYVFISAFAIASLILHWIWPPLGWIGALLTLWCAYFFRDPARVTPDRDGLVVAPADGYVCSIGSFAPPPELGLGAEPMHRISIFMSVFDCHVNRAPVAGRIARIAYKPGLFVNADLDKASEDNERMSVRVDTADGRSIAFVQIAGLVARRIRCDLADGQAVRAGERYGLIRFGSRVDVYLPPGAAPLVAVGQYAIGGETVFADLNSREPAREGEER